MVGAGGGSGYCGACCFFSQQDSGVARQRGSEGVREWSSGRDWWESVRRCHQAPVLTLVDHHHHSHAFYASTSPRPNNRLHRHPHHLQSGSQHLRSTRRRWGCRSSLCVCDWGGSECRGAETMGQGTSPSPSPRRERRRRDCRRWRGRKRGHQEGVGVVWVGSCCIGAGVVMGVKERKEEQKKKKRGISIITIEFVWSLELAMIYPESSISFPLLWLCLSLFQTKVSNRSHNPSSNLFQLFTQYRLLLSH